MVNFEQHTLLGMQVLGGASIDFSHYIRFYAEI